MSSKSELKLEKLHFVFAVSTLNVFSLPNSKLLIFDLFCLKLFSLKRQKMIQSIILNTFAFVNVAKKYGCLLK